MWSEPKFTSWFSGVLSSGGLLRSDWLPPNRVIAHYHKVNLISTLIDALIVQNVPRRSRRSSPPALIENEWLPATLTLSPRPVWTHRELCRQLDLDKLHWSKRTYKWTQCMENVPGQLLQWYLFEISFLSYTGLQVTDNFFLQCII